jgi:AraC family transcriptional regulator
MTAMPCSIMAGDTMAAQVLAEGRDWRLAEYVCCAGPGDRPFEERHDAFTIAAVVEGTFKYRSETGSALLYPGAVLLGNRGTCFECGHEHGTGDRCIALHVTSDAFGEVASSAAGSERFRFPVSMLPASAAITPWLVKFYAGRMSVCLATTEPLNTEVSVLRFLEEMIGLTADAKPSAVQVSARDERRLSAVIRYIELNALEKLDLDHLSTMAGMSKYHFLRTFRRTVGLTPHQFVLGIRLRRAAGRLLTAAAPISAIAFEAGFGDLSTFNARFRKQFGITPRGYRLREGPR